MATRRTQPYRKGLPRSPGGALTNMMRGRTLHGTNPMDARRGLAKLAGKSPSRRRRKPRRRTPGRHAPTLLVLAKNTGRRAL